MKLYINNKDVHAVKYIHMDGEKGMRGDVCAHGGKYTQAWIFTHVYEDICESLENTF